MITNTAFTSGGSAGRAVLMSCRHLDRQFETGGPGWQWHPRFCNRGAWQAVEGLEGIHTKLAHR